MDKNNKTNIFKIILMIIGGIILLRLTLINPVVLIVIVVIIISNIKKKKKKNTGDNLPSSVSGPPPIVETQLANIKCQKCGREYLSANTRCPSCGTPQKESFPVCNKCGAEQVQKNTKYCRECGEPLFFNGAQTKDENYASNGTLFDRTEFNNIMNMTDDLYIESLVKEEIEKCENKNISLKDIETTKSLSTIIYMSILFILLLLYVSFHTNLGFILFLIIVLTIIYFMINKKFDIAKRLTKEVKNRPDEKISYVVTSHIQSKSCSKSKGLYIRGGIITLFVVISLILFRTPHMIYEHQDEGYVLRYYTYGLLKNYSEITIPKEYKGEKVIGIRGDAFKNVTSIKKVNLPTTIKEIRGGAFSGCSKLEEINIPDGIEEIAGETFMNCRKLTHMHLPESITKIGGSAFQGCSNLYEINIPYKVDEIRGSTFEDCFKLEIVNIPDGTTRIGGSAFRNCYNLKEITIPQSVTEIGSSAFRNTGLTNVCISKTAYVNERAFKETYSKIFYYEDGCGPAEEYGDYNGY